MIEIRGQYTSAKIFSDTVEGAALDQIRALCDLPFAAGARVRVMPDVHAGAGCVIGFTADIRDSVIPNIVGVDIGCGMRTVLLGKGTFDFEKLDEAVRRYIPAGMDVHEGRIERFPALQQLHCYRDLKNSGRLERSLGTLGGGEEEDEDDDDVGTLFEDDEDEEESDGDSDFDADDDMSDVDEDIRFDDLFSDEDDDGMDD